MCLTPTQEYLDKPRFSIIISQRRRPAMFLSTRNWLIVAILAVLLVASFLAFEWLHVPQLSADMKHQIMLLQQAYSLADTKKANAEAKVPVPAIFTNQTVAEYVKQLATTREPFEDQERLLFGQFALLVQNNRCEHSWIPRRRH